MSSGVSGETTWLLMLSIVKTIGGRSGLSVEGILNGSLDPPPLALSAWNPAHSPPSLAPRSSSPNIQLLKNVN